MRNTNYTKRMPVDETEDDDLNELDEVYCPDCRRIVCACDELYEQYKERKQSYDKY